MTATITRALIALLITLAALMLIGFLWIVNLGMEETSVSTVVRGQTSRRVSLDDAEVARQEGSIP